MAPWSRWRRSLGPHRPPAAGRDYDLPPRRQQVDNSEGPGDLQALYRVYRARPSLRELKSAYLIGFTSLGYSWALAPELDAVRSALLNCSLRSLGPHVVSQLASARQELAGTVITSADSWRIAVIGEDGRTMVSVPGGGEANSALTVNGDLVHRLQVIGGAMVATLPSSGICTRTRMPCIRP